MLVCLRARACVCVCVYVCNSLVSKVSFKIHYYYTVTFAVNLDVSLRKKLSLEYIRRKTLSLLFNFRQKYPKSIIATKLFTYCRLHRCQFKGVMESNIEG